MDYNRIRSLLHKYWNCETTLQEEEELRSFFSTRNVPDDLKPYSSLFQYFLYENEAQVSDGFDEKILMRIGKGKEKSQKQVFLSIFYKVAAAVILILFTVTVHQKFIKVREKATTLVQDTFDDPEKALEQTKKALLLVSEKWNKGKANVGRLSEFNKAEKIIRNENL